MAPSAINTPGTMMPTSPKNWRQPWIGVTVRWISSTAVVARHRSACKCEGAGLDARHFPQP
jgi:hypothetical protein